MILRMNNEAVAGSTSCSINITANTSDVSTKDDADALFDNPEPTYVDWECSNESFVANKNDLVKLMRAWVESTELNVDFVCGINDAVPGWNCTGKAFISSLSVKAAMGEKATVSLSLTGNGPLTMAAGL